MDKRLRVALAAATFVLDLKIVRWEEVLPESAEAIAAHGDGHAASTGAAA